jgi:catalase
MGAAQDFVRDAYGHLKVLAFTSNTEELFTRAGIDDHAFDDACLPLAKAADAGTFIDVAAKGKFWDREPAVRPLPPGPAAPKKGK